MNTPTSDQIAGKNMARKMALWLLMVSVTLLFGALGLAYLSTTAREARISVPPLFVWNTLALVMSSVLLHSGWVKRKRFEGRLMAITLVLGGVFLVAQAFAWYQLYAQGLFLNGVSRKISFLYVLTGIHAAHLVGGLAFLAFAWYQLRQGKHTYYESAVYFWHFLGVLWIYLLGMLFINH
jgi:cytochrome c oxidase subunit 3